MTHTITDLLTPPEVARIVDWRRPERRSELAWIKIGNRVRYRRADVEAFIAARELGPRGAGGSA